MNPATVQCAYELIQFEEKEIENDCGEGRPADRHDSEYHLVFVYLSFDIRSSIDDECHRMFVAVYFIFFLFASASLKLPYYENNSHIRR